MMMRLRAETALIGFIWFDACLGPKSVETFRESGSCTNRWQSGQCPVLHYFVQ